MTHSFLEVEWPSHLLLLKGQPPEMKRLGVDLIQNCQIPCEDCALPANFPISNHAYARSASSPHFPISKPPHPFQFSKPPDRFPFSKPPDQAPSPSHSITNF
ncbi:hypothetical protein HBI81_040170 [Parastagonospora nodorum]|nr:hypothetical protein HBH53_113220 [Parastagonospora nodorum]KAH3969141.1 hypothetical protein HBH52_176660 [Parastagonospora nodorum]KAH5178633.1 hypothetical protein HBH76_189460 [Parastagonospora nodorum]KAH5261501.1 hypothetical protein HBI70_159800 [Parastagonospora nodorum]KAH5411454.1 hypothetical protein HBI46_157160 [Parastagonospora nodorum]